MFVLGTFLLAVGKVLNITLTVYIWVIVIRAIMSWIPQLEENPNHIVSFIKNITDPFFGWIRYTLRLPYLGGIDTSPLIAILIVLFVKYFVVTMLFRIGLSLGGRL